LVTTNEFVLSYVKFEVVSTTAVTPIDCQLSMPVDDGLFLKRTRTVVVEPQGSGAPCDPLTIWEPFVEPTCGKIATM
jgi:hypothetical protein